MKRRFRALVLTIVGGLGLYFIPKLQFATSVQVYSGPAADTLDHWISDGELDHDMDDRSVQDGPRPTVPTKLAPNSAKELG